MALPSSGELGFDDIANQLRYTQPYSFLNCNFNNTQWRGLAQRPDPDSLISIANFHGKWAGTKCQNWDQGSGSWGTHRNVAGYFEGDYNGVQIDQLRYMPGVGGYINLYGSAPASKTLRITDNNMIEKLYVTNLGWTASNPNTVAFFNMPTNVFGTVNGTFHWFTWP
jgi:hypothetical protein